ncbi:BrnT family toxin [Brevundimonas sp. TWP2-3-4b1]|uniref:BrnT family toxin n=1 Tax=Brevundimonas sp. TWP2-3-4b1 TaxID=2804580 RepID=UPI003CECA7A8
MSIDFDPAKDAVNRAKHGVSLALAAAGDWTAAFIAPDDRRDYGEPRWYAYLPIDGRVHVVVYKERDDITRIISLRRANPREVRKYDELRTG